MKRARAEGWLGAALLALLVLLALFLGVGPRQGATIEGSIGSVEDEGRRALALLLGRVGIAAEAWHQVPAALPRGPHAAWLARRPHAGIFPEADEDEDEEAARVGMHALEHYAAFVRRGGTLIVEGEDGLDFLRDDLELAAAQDLELVQPGDGARSLRFSSGEHARVACAALVGGLDPAGDVRELAVVATGKDEGVPFAVAIPEGSGRAILIADGGFLDNARIGEHEHALAAVRLAEEALLGGRMLLDEYALGLWSPESALTVASRGAFALVSLHALLLLALWTWMRASPRAFPRDPEPLESFSPLLRAKAHARLFERAGRAALLAVPLRRAACRRLCARLRIPWRLARDAGGALPRALVERVAAELGPERGPRAVELLAARRVRTRDDLEQLVRELGRIERGLRG